MILRRAILGVSLVAMPATAQDTRLRLVSVGSARRVANELFVVCRAEHRNTQAPLAQAAVARNIAAGTEAAALVPGVRAESGRVSISRPGFGRETQVMQTLTLRGADPVPLLDLAVRLQQSGFTVISHGWQLSDPELLALRDRAMTEALRLLHLQANATAGALGLQLGSIRDISFDLPQIQQPGSPRSDGGGLFSGFGGFVSGSGYYGPPSSPSEEITVSMRVTADFTLSPR